MGTGKGRATVKRRGSVCNDIAGGVGSQRVLVSVYVYIYILIYFFHDYCKLIFRQGSVRFKGVVLFYLGYLNIRYCGIALN